MNTDSGASRARCGIGLAVALSILLSSVSVVPAAEDLDTLPRPESTADPRWLGLLPPLTLPLDKPTERAARLSNTRPLPDDARTTDAGETVAEPLEETPPPQPAPDMAMSADVPETATGEETEDAAMIDVIETLPIAPPAPDSLSTRTAPETETPDESSRYRWHVQLLAGRSLERVKEDQRLFVHRHGDLIQGLSLTISQSRYGDARDEFYRLRVLEWPARQPAVDWCKRLLERGHRCLVTRIIRRVE
jgi:hypothetical protein